jgi:hypothetical protein
MNMTAFCTEPAGFSVNSRDRENPGLLRGMNSRAGQRNLRSEPVNDTCLSDIVRGHLHLDTIPDGQTDKTLSHLSRNMGKNEMFIGKLHTKHCSWEDSGNFSFDDD